MERVAAQQISSRFSVQKGLNSNIIILNDIPSKKFLIFFMFLMILGGLLSVIFSRTADLNEIGQPSVLDYKMFALFSIFLICSFFFLMLYPLRITIESNSDGSITINKIDSFFTKKEWKLTRNQEPYVYGRKRFMVGGHLSFFSERRYQPIIKYRGDNSEKEINLLYIGEFMVGGLAPSGLLQKDELQFLAQNLEMQLIVNE